MLEAKAGFSQEALSGVAFKDQSRRKKIIAYLSSMGESTVNELAELLNISIPKATELINGLENEGFVKTTGRRNDGPGRKAAVFALAPDSFYFVGLEIKKYAISIGLMGFDKQLIYHETDIPFLFESTTISLSRIVDILHEFFSRCGVPREKIAGIGCSISGRVNVHTGAILTIYHFGDAPVKELLEKEFGIPVLLDNDSRTISYGEFHFGKRSREKEVLVLNIDYGVAVGIFVKGMPVYGISGYAGELGHIPLFDNEKICFCGKKGCLETEASGKALIENIEKAMERGSNSLLQPILAEKGRIELEDVLDVIRRGDNLALSEMARIASSLGRALAVTINLLNPELIIIGGKLSAVGDALLLPVKSFILRHSLSVVNNDTRLELSELGDKAGLLGCCLLVRDKILGIV